MCEAVLTIVQCFRSLLENAIIIESISEFFETLKSNVDYLNCLNEVKLSND